MAKIEAKLELDRVLDKVQKRDPLIEANPLWEFA